MTNTQKCKSSNNFNKKGILLVNLGSPQSYKTIDVKNYLREFLSDYRVIDLNPLKWKFILNFFVLAKRSPKVAKIYESIWNKKTNESPLIYYTKKQTEKLQERYKNDNVIVDFAMRYSKPQIKNKIDGLLNNGCDEIIIVPLYPQYSSTTSGTVIEESMTHLMKLKRIPQVTFINKFYKNEIYLNAIADKINNAIEKENPEKIILTYHGIPKRYRKNKDPYICHCKKTTNLLKEKINFNPDNILTTFQSIFGKEEWVKPYTNQTLKQLGENGIKNVLITSPCFISDCIETIDEIDVELREDFISNGGKTFNYVECLNDDKECIDLLHDITSQYLK